MPFPPRAAGRWYDLKLEVEGHHARGYVDGKLVMDVTDDPHQPVAMAFASASYLNASGEVVVKVVNSAETALDAEIQVKGASQVGSGKAIVLAAEPNAVNSIEQPTLVAPKEEPLALTAASFSHTFAPHSVTLLRFPAKK
jgi:alpha-N-arabinofuranosidase